MAFCGYCATPLLRPAINPIHPPTIRGSSAEPKPFKPEIRPPVIHSPTPPPPTDGGESKGKGSFELIPWSELSPTQRAGRSIAAAVGLLLILLVVRVVWRSLGSATRGSSETAPSEQSSGVPITEGDRKDGIESLCKVFQIYGLPKNEHDAAEAARNAAELFKLAGNQSAERSAYILTSIVHEFRSGKLSPNDCAQAGAPIATTQESTDDSTPDVNR